MLQNAVKYFLKIANQNARPSFVKVLVTMATTWPSFLQMSSGDLLPGTPAAINMVATYNPSIPYKWEK